MMRRECEMMFDQYRDGVWYHHTGYEVFYLGQWWGEFEDSNGNIELLR